MVIHPKLLSWWEDLHFSDQALVRKYLGNLPSLLEIQPNNKIIEATTLFRDCERSVFFFGDIEMTPLLEEIEGLAGIAWETPGLLMLENCKAGASSKLWVSSCTLATSSYSTRSKGPPPTPPLSLVRNNSKGKMEDLNNARKKNSTKRVEVTHGYGNQVSKENASQLEQKLLNFQEELDQGYKPPKFKMFVGTRDPRVHLITYYDKLVGVGKDERIHMKLFMRNLKGDVLSWYISQDPKKWSNWVGMASDFMDRFRFNTENALDVFYIQNLKKEPIEIFREYATRWRSEAAKVRPTLEEEQMNNFFVRAQDLQYYERLILIESHKFSNIIQLGERIEEGIKSGMVTNFKALQATNKALQPCGMSKKRDVGAVMVS
ncbi:uncharacterized protein [Nicotiana sylvestris]|uniref:uncharacterized protein n=1 Tax=Nicotiana sylvestris TaxID=4096 RepID=UPI00388CCCED